MDGVSTYLALTFSTLLSSQGTDASFGFPSGAPPGFSLRCFVLAFPTLSDSFVSDSPSEGVLLLSARPFRSAVPTFQTLADFPGRLIIESFECNFRHGERSTRWGFVSK